nr:PAS domain-containing protein [Chloroflexota bacterium]
ASGLITHWNRRAEHEFGWRREEAVGRNAADLVAPPKMLEAARAGLAMLPTIAAGDLPEALPYVARDRNGTTFAVELTMAPVGTPDHPGYAVFITRTPSDS